MKANAVQEAIGELVLGFDHMNIAVRDLERSIAWYEGALGFRLIQRRVTRGERTSMKSALLAAGRAFVVLAQGCEPESQVSRFVAEKGEGVAHIAFAVSDLDEAIRRLEAATGRPVGMPKVEEEGLRQIFLEGDPESGVRIELIERKGGTFTDDSVTRMFRALEDRDLY